MQSDIQALEFDGIRRLLEKLTSTPYGTDAAHHLAPAPDINGARQMQAAVSAARSAIDAGELPPLVELPDVRAALRQAETPGAALNTTALANLLRVMEEAEALAPHLERYPALYPAGHSMLQAPVSLVERLRSCINHAGHLHDDASEELAKLHQEQSGLRQEAEQAVLARMQQADIVELLDDKRKVTWQGARAVITIRAVHADLVKGVRRGSAMGGRDQVVEPIEAVAANNRIETVDGQVRAEQQRLLRELTDEVRDHLEPLQRIITAIAWIDLALAGGHLSVHLNGHAPTLSEDTLVELQQAYHPLLLLQYADGNGPQPVPLSIRLDNEQRMMVITGPNTGGKTVVLKTLGLLITMAHCGLHIPAERDCTIGNYRRVMVDVGDSQSLYHHLSTFAGHVEKLKRILAEADDATMVLLDELGTGTDPEEGAALAMSVIDELIARGVHGVVNTHLSPLKDYAEGRKHVVNASMRFDHEQLRPTYQLQVGVPGRSLGLIIAEKNGLPEDLVARAREHLSRISGQTGS